MTYNVFGGMFQVSTNYSTQPALQHHLRLGRRLNLINSLRLNSFALPFPNFTGVGVKSLIWSRLFKVIFQYLRSSYRPIFDIETVNYSLSNQSIGIEKIHR